MSIEQEARAEAEKRIPSALLENITDPLPVDWKRKGLHEGFAAGYIAGASRPVTDEQADAAQIAFYEFVFGPDVPLTARDIGITRQAWKVAIQAARALADKETP